MNRESDNGEPGRLQREGCVEVSLPRLSAGNLPTLADHIVSVAPGDQLNASCTQINLYSPEQLLIVGYSMLYGRGAEYHTLFCNTWVVLCSVLISHAISS